MLRNFVTTEDLKAFYPRVDKQLWAGVTDYATQIRQGFNRVLTDLHNSNIDPRRIMIPLDLTVVQAQVKSNQNLNFATVTGSVVGSAAGGSYQPNWGFTGAYGVPYIQSAGQLLNEYYSTFYVNLNQRRFVVRSSAHTGNWTVKLQGNNIQTSSANTGIPPANDSNWIDINLATISIVSGSVDIEQSVKFDDQYRWYRMVATGDDPGATIVFSAATFETVFEDLTIYAAFAYIFRDFVKDDADIWDKRRQWAEDDYEKYRIQCHFMYDANDDGILTVDDEEKVSSSITLIR